MVKDYFSVFKRPVDVFRIKSEISQEDENFGHKVESIEKEFTIQADYQPTSQDDVLNLPEGRSFSQTLNLTTTTDLIVADFDKTNTHNSDLLLIEGRFYEVLSKKEYQQNVINHYEYVVVLSERKLPI